MKRFVDLWQHFSIEHLWPLVVMVGIAMFVNTHPVLPNDFWWHMAIGRDILTEGKIPLYDVYSFTQPGVLYLSYQQFWLMDIFLYLVYRAGGLILTILVQTLIITTAYGLLLMLAYRHTLSWRAAAAAVLFAAALGFGNWNVRPQTIAYLYAVLLLYSIDQLRSDNHRRWLFVFPVVMALWVNSHGSFPIGFALVGIWWFEEALPYVIQRKWPGLSWSRLTLSTIAFVSALVGALANPRGIGFIDYLSSLTANSTIQSLTTEWMPPTFDTLEGGIFLAILLGLAVLMAVSPRRPGLRQILYFLIFGYLSLNYIRSVVWFGLVLAPFVAEDIAALLNRFGVTSAAPASSFARRINAVFLVVMAFLLIISLPPFKPLLPFTPEKAGLAGFQTPVEATRFLLDRRYPGRVFHYQAFGSYLIWAAHPAYPVFIDPRIEMYPPELWIEYLQISSGADGWDTKLMNYGVNILMLDPESQSGLLAAAEDTGEWVEVYTDPAVVILVRRSALARQAISSIP